MNIIELDVDGVLLDVYTPVEKYLASQGLYFSFKDSVRTWGMRETGILRPMLLKLLTDAEIRKNADWYDGAVNFVEYIARFCKRHNYKLVLNTHESNYAAAKVKLDKLEGLKKEVTEDFDINVQCSPCKEMLNSYICIDDSLDNICRSTAKCPILFNSFHNTEMYNGPRKGFKRVDTYAGVMGAVIMFDRYGVTS